VGTSGAFCIAAKGVWPSSRADLLAEFDALANAFPLRYSIQHIKARR